MMANYGAEDEAQPQTMENAVVSKTVSGDKEVGGDSPPAAAGGDRITSKSVRNKVDFTDSSDLSSSSALHSEHCKPNNDVNAESPILIEQQAGTPKSLADTSPTNHSSIEGQPELETHAISVKMSVNQEVDTAPPAKQNAWHHFICRSTSESRKKKLLYRQLESARLNNKIHRFRSHNCQATAPPPSAVLPF